MLANKIGANDATVVKTIADYFESIVCDLAKVDRVYRDSDRALMHLIAEEDD